MPKGVLNRCTLIKIVSKTRIKLKHVFDYVR